MNFETFKLERFQSLWENQVEINLSESGVLPMSLNELRRIAQSAARRKNADAEVIRRLLKTSLGYSQTNGTIPLRRHIARLYPGATEENIEVTHGSSEANFITLWRLVERGDEVIVMLPNYMQVWGLAQALKAKMRPWWLRPVSSEKRPEIQWAPDLNEFKKLVSKKTRLICVCHPNNPTGAVLSRKAMRLIIERARWAGAWVLADEVYQGAELDGSLTPSFWSVDAGKRAPYEKLILSNSLSKAYGLPGLRLGWLVGSRAAIQHSWAAHDYTTIGPSALSDALATVALRPTVRPSILERTRRILRSQWPLLESWVHQRRDVFELSKPRAGAVALLKYAMKINSTDLAEQLRRQKSVLIVPGDHFLLDGYLRVGFGGNRRHLKRGLEKLGELVSKMHN